MRGAKQHCGSTGEKQVTCNLNRNRRQETTRMGNWDGIEPAWDKTTNQKWGLRLAKSVKQSKQAETKKQGLKKSFMGLYELLAGSKSMRRIRLISRWGNRINWPLWLANQASRNLAEKTKRTNVLLITLLEDWKRKPRNHGGTILALYC